MAWWKKDRLEDKMPFLMARQKIKLSMQNWFAKNNFQEVETAQLQYSPGNEVHLLGLSTIWTAPNLNSKELFLATSPEFSCKKLIAGGMERIYEFARVFRNRDLSNIHAPEFTMLEFYKTNCDWLELINDCLELIKNSAKELRVKSYKFGKYEIDIEKKPKFLKVADAFLQYANINLHEMLDENGNGLIDIFKIAALQNGIKINEDDDWSNIFTKIMLEKIEPNIGKNEICIFYEYPYPEGALAQRCKNNKKFVERFEIYICGIEIANGFGELIDNIEQRKRFEIAMKKQYEIYGKSYLIDEDLLNAINSMPPTSGVAIGFDRLVMVISGARNINDVLWTPFILGE